MLTTVKCDLFKTRYMFLRGERGELRTLLKGNMSDWCQPPPISWYVFCLFYMQVSSLVISYIGLQKDKFTSTFWAAVWQARVGDELIQADKCVVRLLCFSGCVNTSFSISMLHYSHMMESSCTQPANCVVCSSLTLVKTPKAANDISNRLRAQDTSPDSAVGLSRYR